MGVAVAPVIRFKNHRFHAQMGGDFFYQRLVVTAGNHGKIAGIERMLIDHIDYFLMTCLYSSKICEKIQSQKFKAKIQSQKFKAKAKDLKRVVAGGKALDDILPEAFALVREAAKRTLNQKHYDVQLIGGLVLHQGGIAEMKTGEGKTL